MREAFVDFVNDCLVMSIFPVQIPCSPIKSIIHSKNIPSTAHLPSTAIKKYQSTHAILAVQMLTSPSSFQKAPFV
jgi:hypothetical protein